MKKYIISRDIPGAGKLTPEELQAIAKTSVAVITVMGRPYTWKESFVTGNRVYCIHEAENEDDIREHSSCGELPITLIEEVRAVISPATANEGR
jgi:hypothetical protein